MEEKERAFGVAQVISRALSGGPTALIVCRDFERFAQIMDEVRSPPASPGRLIWVGPMGSIYRWRRSPVLDGRSWLELECAVDAFVKLLDEGGMVVAEDVRRAYRTWQACKNTLVRDRVSLDDLVAADEELREAITDHLLRCAPVVCCTRNALVQHRVLQRRKFDRSFGR